MISQKHFPAECLAKNITLFRLFTIVIHDLLKDPQKIIIWTAEYNIHKLGHRY